MRVSCAPECMQKLRLLGACIRYSSPRTECTIYLSTFFLSFWQHLEPSLLEIRIAGCRTFPLICTNSSWCIFLHAYFFHLTRPDQARTHSVSMQRVFDHFSKVKLNYLVCVCAFVTEQLLGCTNFYLMSTPYGSVHGQSVVSKYGQYTMLPLQMNSGLV